MALPVPKPIEPKEGVEQKVGGQKAPESTIAQPTSPKSNVLDPTTAYVIDPRNPDKTMLGTEAIAAINRGKQLDEERSMRQKTENELKVRDTALEEALTELEELKLNAKLMEGLERLTPKKSGSGADKQATENWFTDQDEDPPPPVDVRAIAREIGNDTKQAVTAGLGDTDARIEAAVKAQLARLLGEQRAAEQVSILRESSVNARRAQLGEKYRGLLEAGTYAPAEIDRWVKLDDASHNSYAEADQKAQVGDFEGANELLALRDELMNQRITAEAEALLQKRQMEQQREYDERIESGAFPGMPERYEDVVIDKPEFNQKKAQESKEKRHTFARDRLLKRARARIARGGD